MVGPDHAGGDLVADATLIFRSPTLVKMGDVTIDCSINERHNASSQITDHAVEEGSPLTDHSRPQPRKLAITGVISGTPLRTTEDVPLTPGQAFEELVRLKDTAQTLTVVTALVTYENMLIETIDTTRTAQSGTSLEFEATLKQIRKARAIERVVRVRTATPGTKGKVKTGPKVKADGPQQNPAKAMKKQAESWLSSAVSMDENTSEVPRGSAGIPSEE